jgi:hypothetical protein
MAKTTLRGNNDGKHKARPVLSLAGQALLMNTNIQTTLRIVERYAANGLDALRN